MNQFFGFQGRVGRGTWWIAVLAPAIVAFLGFVTVFGVASATSGTAPSGWSSIAFLAWAVAQLASAVATICVTVKRYHDRGKSGWWWWLGLVPFLGLWQIIECGFCSGDDGDNEYGPPPGAESRMKQLGAEVSAMANNGLSKVDDNYLADYAKSLSHKPSNQQSPSIGGFNPNANARPAFGKR